MVQMGQRSFDEFAGPADAHHWGLFSAQGQSPVIPAAAPTQTNAGMVDGQCRHQDQISLIQSLSWQCRHIGFVRPPAGNPLHAIQIML